MTLQNINGISFPMKEVHDFSFLNRYGRVFCAFSQNDSGNISFGVESSGKRYFIKIAGARTAQSTRKPEEAVRDLKAAAVLYSDLAHPNLIKLIEHYPVEDLYVLVFSWALGECLFDHWNFDSYANNPELVPPRTRFSKLPSAKKLAVFDTVFDFLTLAEERGYVAVDFYDGSLMYDFEHDRVTICDIDFFRKSPAHNDIGEDFYGSKRMKSPEEYILGATIDRVTNVFLMGAMLLHFFGSYTKEEIKKMNRENAFFPCRYELGTSSDQLGTSSDQLGTSSDQLGTSSDQLGTSSDQTWELSEDLYKLALKAVSQERTERFQSVKAFYEQWKRGRVKK